MQFGTPTPPGDSAGITPFCYAAGWTCELCGARHATVVVRATPYGPACLDLCPACQALPEPLQLRTGTAAREHREHLTRAADIADPRRGTS